MTPLARAFLPLLVGGLALSIASCGPGHPPTYPAGGKVFYKGKPAQGAQVFLVPLEGGDDEPRPGAQVKKDGSFRLSTFRSHDGAPAGRYAVTIVYRSPERKADDDNLGPDLLRGRYGDPKTTPLRAMIEAGT